MNVVRVIKYMADMHNYRTNKMITMMIDIWNKEVIYKQDSVNLKKQRTTSNANTTIKRLQTALRSTSKQINFGMIMPSIS